MSLINKKSVDKPGSVVDNHSSGTNVAVCLKQPTQIARESRVMVLQPSNRYLALLRVGFTLPRLLPNARCALTTPFHPYLKQLKPLRALMCRRYIFCGTFRRLSPPRRYLALYSSEPGLSSLC